MVIELYNIAVFINRSYQSNNYFPIYVIDSTFLKNSEVK